MRHLAGPEPLSSDPRVRRAALASTTICDGCIGLRQEWRILAQLS